jgi:hypothetical protein
MGQSTKSLDTIPMTPLVNPGQVRFVLSWPDAPADLDIHSIFKISRVAKCEVFFSKKECAGVDLDVDNLKGGKNGVETITVREMGKYIYTFTVHRYLDVSDGTSQDETPIEGSPSESTETSIAPIPLNESKATVTVYANGFKGPIISVTVPNQVPDGIEANDANWWTVFCLDGSKGLNSLSTINTLGSFKPIYSGCENYFKNK